MNRWTLAALLLSAFASCTFADMTLFISEVNDDLVLNLRGSIDTSAFDVGPLASIRLSDGVFIHERAATTYDAGVRVTIHSSLTSVAVPGYTYWLHDDDAMSEVGFRPPAFSVVDLAPLPHFWFGYGDMIPLPGVPMDWPDYVILPWEYSSKETIDLIYTLPNTSLTTLGLTAGDFWGATFTDGEGGSQAVLFRVVPEPSCFRIAILCLVGAFLSVKRRHPSFL